jgi:hypothetical protein
MWHPVELHNPKVLERGLREALVGHLSTYPHHILVSHGEQVGTQLQSGSKHAEELVRKLEASSVAYIGVSHMRLVAPFCTFSLAPELGIARIEHLVDSGPLPVKRSEQKWLVNALASFLFVLFREHHNIQQVALPFEMNDEEFDGFRIENQQGHLYAMRTSLS